MRTRLALLIAAAFVGLSAQAAEPQIKTEPAKPTKPEVVKPIDMKTDENATQGPSAPPRTFGQEVESIERDEDRAERNKEKFRRRPGYQEEAPQPRAEAPEPAPVGARLVLATGQRTDEGPSKK